MNPAPAIIVRNVNKTYGPFQAVKNLSFEVPGSQCFGLLGPNGAGKTTMLKIIYAKCERDDIDSSKVDVFGFDPAFSELDIRYLSGIVPQEDNLDSEVNVIQNLLIYARFYGMPKRIARSRIDELLAFMELTDKKKAQIRELSGGMKRRLVITRALLHQPKLLILDEPTTGLDPQVRHLIWDKLRQLKKEGISILLTTHYMEEAYQLCDSILIMHQGGSILEGDPRKLLEEHIEKFVLELRDKEAADLEQLDSVNGVRSEGSLGIPILYADELDTLQAIVRQVDSRSHIIRQANLEDLFLKTTGRELNAQQ